jgi:hypothetical protein
MSHEGGATSRVTSQPRTNPRKDNETQYGTKAAIHKLEQEWKLEADDLNGRQLDAPV